MVKRMKADRIKYRMWYMCDPEIKEYIKSEVEEFRMWMVKSLKEQDKEIEDEIKKHIESFNRNLFKNYLNSGGTFL